MADVLGRIGQRLASTLNEAKYLRESNRLKFYNGTAGAQEGKASGEAFVEDAMHGLYQAADIMKLPRAAVDQVTKTKMFVVTPKTTLADGTVVRARYARSVHVLPKSALPEGLVRTLTGGGTRADHFTTSNTVKGLQLEMTKKNLIYGLTQDVGGNEVLVLGGKGNFQGVTVLEPGPGSKLKVGDEIPFQKLAAGDQEQVIDRVIATMPEGHFSPRGDMTAPDINTGATQMDMIAKRVALGGVRSKSVIEKDAMTAQGPVKVIDPSGGIVGRPLATGLGADLVGRQIMERAGLAQSESKQILQGYGAASRPYAVAQFKSGAEFHAINDGYVNDAGTFVPVTLKNDKGIDIEKLEAHVKAHGSIRGFTDEGTTQVEGPDAAKAFWATKADVAVAGARENTLTLEHSQSALDAGTYYGGRKILLEIANNPTTADAKPLWDEQAVVGPDFLVNGLGSGVSNAEVKQNVKGVAFSEPQVFDLIRDLGTKAVDNLFAVSEQYGIPLRQAGDVYALRKLLELHGVDADDAQSVTAFISKPGGKELAIAALAAVGTVTAGGALIAATPE